MPRLTQQQYERNFELLRQDWQEGGRLIGNLDAHHQMILHTYYPITAAVSGGCLRQHRRKIQRASPSLASCAGKSMMQFHRYHLHDAPHTRARVDIRIYSAEAP